jgi:hypothetical protein
MWYEFNSQSEFDAWHNGICEVLGYPLTPINQSTGEPDETAEKTTGYTTAIEVDGKFIALIEDEFAEKLTPTDLRPAKPMINEA